MSEASEFPEPPKLSHQDNIVIDYLERYDKAEAPTQKYVKEFNEVLRFTAADKAASRAYMGVTEVMPEHVQFAIESVYEGKHQTANKVRQIFVLFIGGLFTYAMEVGITQINNGLSQKPYDPIYLLLSIIAVLGCGIAFWVIFK